MKMVVYTREFHGYGLYFAAYEAIVQYRCTRDRIARNVSAQAYKPVCYDADADESLLPFFPI